HTSHSLLSLLCVALVLHPLRSTLFPYTTLFRSGKLPDMVVACVGGGSNAIGSFADYIDDKDVQLIGCEAAGKGVDTDQTAATIRSEEHTSELQSRFDLVCRLLLEKKKRRIFSWS